MFAIVIIITAIALTKLDIGVITEPWDYSFNFTRGTWVAIIGSFKNTIMPEAFVTILVKVRVPLVCSSY